MQALILALFLPHLLALKTDIITEFTRLPTALHLNTPTLTPEITGNDSAAAHLKNLLGTGHALMKIIKAIPIFAIIFLSYATLAQTDDVDLLSDAISKGDMAQIDALHAKGVNINTPNYLGWTPLYRAMINGNITIIQQLFAAGAAANAKNKDGSTALFAVPEGREDLADLLLSKSADVNAANDTGWTPLLWAIYGGGGGDHIAHWLLAKGAKVDTKNNDGATALHLAVKIDGKGLADDLLAHGADSNAKNKDGRTPLHLAAEKGVADIAELLLAKGADINVQDQEGMTALMLALYNKHPALTELLIAKGADVTFRAKSGETALHVAASYGTMALAEQLLNKGADVNAETDSGGSPLDNAVFHSNNDIAALFKAKGAILEHYRCTSTVNGVSTGSIRHGPCPSPTDQRELLPEAPTLPKISIAAPTPQATTLPAPAEPPKPVELVRCTSTDGKSSTLQRGECASADDTQTPVEPKTPVLKRSPTNTQIIKCTSPDGSRVSIQQGNCASPDDIQQLMKIR